MDTAYKVIADRIIAALDAGVVPWRKPWTVSLGQTPHNATSKRPYTGINALILGISGYSDPRWTTYKAARKLGGFVRKGEKGTPVTFWRNYDRKCDPAHPGTVCNGCDTRHPGIRRFWTVRYYTVFNVEQIDGIDWPVIEDLGEEFDPIKAAEAVVNDWAGKPSITHDGGDQAYYRPGTDSIHLPPRSAFSGAEGFYSTMFHELGHSTGHESRLNRHGLETGIAPFGSETYSKEELAAEFTSAFIASKVGITNTVENSTAYITGWAKALRKDPKLVMQAASQGQKAADLILGDKA